MAYPELIHNLSSRPAPLDCEVESVITDAAISSLGAAAAAAVALRKIDGVTREQVLSAAIRVIREQATRHDEIVADFTDEAANHEDQVSDLEIKIGDLRAKLKKAAGFRSP